MRPSYNEKLYNTGERCINLLKYIKLPKIMDVLHKFCPITKGLIIRQADFSGRNGLAGDHVARFTARFEFRLEYEPIWNITPSRPLVSPL